MNKIRKDNNLFVKRISQSSLSIYDPIEKDDPDFWIPNKELETILDQGLRGISIAGLPLRTRSKVVKEYICKILGYPIPAFFKKTKPRFFGQLFDIYIQKSNNLQIWNEDIVASRRYVLIRVSPDDKILKAKVITGENLAKFEKTGKLTQKYQARCITGKSKTELITKEDTLLLKPFINVNIVLNIETIPIQPPNADQLLSIEVIYKELCKFVEKSFRDTGYDQERNRGAKIHRLICKALGYTSYQDDGKFPDIRHQLLEVKLQTSPTIDLGLISPDSKEPLDIPPIQGVKIRHCDVRYAIFYGKTDGNFVTITHFFLTTGEAFFNRFPQFKGKLINRKLQIHLPTDFFNR